MDIKKQHQHATWLAGCTLALGLTGLTACRSHQGTADGTQTGTMSTLTVPKTGKAVQQAVGVSSPIVYIYKMKKDYSQLVPVLMDESRTRIVSYPAPTDLKTNGKLAYPTPLDNGYWLDNRGISPNAVFLSYTYEEYSQLKEAPTMEEMEARIVDRHPFVFIQACGRRADYKDIVKELNEYIHTQGLK